MGIISPVSISEFDHPLAVSAIVVPVVFVSLVRLFAAVAHVSPDVSSVVDLFFLWFYLLCCCSYRCHCFFPLGLLIYLLLKHFWG